MTVFPYSLKLHLQLVAVSCVVLSAAETDADAARDLRFPADPRLMVLWRCLNCPNYVCIKVVREERYSRAIP